MLTKITSKNQVTIPKKIMAQLPDVEYFDVELDEGVIILRPVQVLKTNLKQVRAKIRKLGLSPDSVEEAIEWARSKE